jgi:hydrogenase maturation protease
MNLAPVEAIVKAVLYEGYILYPYRASSVKNRQRWTFGGVYPPDYARQEESCACRVQTECLIRGSLESAIEVHVRFLHLVRREVGEFASPVTELPEGQEPTYSKVASLKVGEEVFQSWEEAIERDVTASSLTLKQLTDAPVKTPFAFAAQRSLKPLRGPDGRVHGLLIHTTADIQGELTIAAAGVAPGVFRLTVRIDNVTPLADPESSEFCEAQWRAFASTHTILGVRGGAFLSLLDPPDELKDAASACNNQGTWPVLAGDEGATDTILSSPIILYDYPQVAPESPGDLFDASEIDEILTLRILAMTDEEKRDMAALDARARALLERTQALTAADMARLHGARRELHLSADPEARTLSTERLPACKPELAFLHAGGRDFAVGDRVRLRPKGRADIFDLVLKDEMAVIEAIERDFDDRVHVAVVLEADPGREFGFDRMPGHRFFFSPDEIEPAGKESRT